MWKQRECQVTVRNGALVRRLLSSALSVDVNPLVVECCVSKEVDSLLVDEEPIALTELLAQTGSKLIVVVDCSFCHSYCFLDV